MSTVCTIALSRFLLSDRDTEQTHAPAHARNVIRTKTNARSRTSNYSAADTRHVITFSLHRECQLHSLLILIKVDRQFE